MIVVDASLVANALADDTADGDRARRRMRADPSLHAPELLDVEVLSVLRKRAAADDLDDNRAAQAVTDLMRLRVLRHRHRLLDRAAWALRHNLTPYDALYAALAAALGCALVTVDGRLARAPGLPCAVEVVAAVDE